MKSLFGCFFDYCVSLLDQILQVVNQNIGQLHFCSPNRIVLLLSKSVDVLVDYKGLHCDLELFWNPIPLDILDQGVEVAPGPVQLVGLFQDVLEQVHFCLDKV